MANTVEIQITADPKNAEAGFRKTQGAFGRMADGIKRHRKAIGVGLTALGAGITALGVSAVKSAQAEAIGIAQLDVALKNVGTSYDSQATAIERVIAAQQKKTNFGDEVQREALMGLISVSGDYEASMAALPAVLDLAAGKSMDLGAASTLVARAISGETSALKRYGIEVKKGAGATEVIAAIMEKFGGQAEAAADPMVQLKNRVGDLQQEFGKALLPALTLMAVLLEKVTAKLIAFATEHPQLTKVLVIVGAALGAVALVLGPLLLLLPTIAASIGILSVAFGALSISMGPVTIAIIAAAAAIAAGILIWKNFDKIVAVVKKGIALFVRGFVENIKLFAKAASAIAGALGLEGLQEKIDQGIGKLDDMVVSMDDWANSGADSIGSIGNEFDSMESHLSEDVGLVSGHLGDMENDLRGVGKAAEDTAEKVEKAAAKEAAALKTLREAFVKSTQEMELQRQLTNNRSLSNQQIFLNDLAIAERDNNEAILRLVDDFYDEWTGKAADAATERERIASDAADRIAKTVQQQTDDMIFEFSAQGVAWDDLGGSAKSVIEAIAKTSGTSASKIANNFSMLIQEGEDWKAMLLRIDEEGVINLVNVRAGMVGLQEEARRTADEMRNLKGAVDEALRGAQRRFEETSRRSFRLITEGPDVGRIVTERGIIDNPFNATPKLAHGGLLRAGQMAIVGERGPELFMPEASGRIIPNGGRAGGMTINLTINGDINGMDEFEEKVTSVIRDAVLGGGFSGVLARA